MPLSVIFHSCCHPSFLFNLAPLFLYFCLPCPPLSLYFLWAQRVERPGVTEAAAAAWCSPNVAHEATQREKEETPQPERVGRLLS